jgi:signal transduction histidine kinase
METDTFDGLDYIVIEVADQGRGIPPERLERIFERFEQVDSSDARHGSGSGLGLAIARVLVEMHGGRLTVTSEPGVGSVFSVTLPTAGPVDDEPI